MYPAAMFDGLIRHILAERIATLLPPRILRWLLAAVASAAILGAAALVVVGAWPLAVALVVLAGITGGAVFVLIPPRRGIVAGVVSHAGALRPAYVAPISRGKSLASVLVSAVIAAMFGALAFFVLADSPTVPYAGAAVFAGVLAFGMAIFAASGLAGAFGDQYVALVRDGVIVRVGLGSTFVPWSALRDVGIDEVEGYGRHRFVYLRVGPMSADSEGVVARIVRVVTALLWMQSPGRGEIRLRSNLLAVPDAVLASLLAHFYANPAARGRIGSAEALAALS
jgi:hypothetical protein